MTEQVIRGQWTSKFTFLMAAIGSAVGLGNIWRFPFLAGENGGSAFMLTFLISTLLMGMPVLIAELALGRMGGGSPIHSLRMIVRRNASPKFWNLIGILSSCCAFLILSYYCVIGGWSLRYLFIALSNGFAAINNQQSADLFNNFTADPMSMTLWHTIYILVNALIVFGGLRNGIEKSVTILMPMLFLLLFALVIYATWMPGFERGFDFLFRPDFSKLSYVSILSAIGQSFFALSIGMGAMIMYGAYLDKDTNIPSCAFVITIADVLVAVMAGLAIFPLVFSFGLEPSAGPGLLFITLPIAFGQMGLGGVVFGVAFFLLVSIAAITSSISMVEVIVVRLEERFGFARLRATALVGAAAWFVGLSSVFSFNLWSDFHPLAPLGILTTGTIFTIIDSFCSNLLIPVTALLVCLYMGWVLARPVVVGALGTENAVLFAIWRGLLRFVAPVGVILILVLALL